MAIDILTSYESMVCPTCGAAYALPENFVRARRDDHQSWYCPGGHSLSFPGKSEAEKLREQLARLQSQTDQDLARLRDRAERNKRSASAAKGQLTKIKNRVGNGVCPCCNRSFSNLAQHMHQQHPTFVAS